MARVFVYALVCFFFIQVGQCALPACTGPDLAGCPANATCTAADQPCTCNAGFHEVGNATCAADIQIGGACTVKDVDTECVGNASCTNMAAEGAAEELKCSCKQGFHTKIPADGGASVCEADIQPGGVCTTKDADAECVEGATCMNVAPEGQAEILQCSCKPDFHEKTPVGGSPVCEADIQPGNICTRNASADECQDGSTCVHATGQVSVLKCTCNAGSHMKTIAGLILCLPDIQPGGACTTVDNATECVANATCKNVTSPQCTCDTGFSVMTNSTTNTSYCRAAMALGSPCTMSGSDAECDGNDTICLHMAREGQAPALTCTCKMGFHMTGTPPVCEADIAPGGPCTMTKDCVAGAQCQNVSAEGTAEGTAQTSQCTCMDKYHVTTVEGKAACEADVLPGQACSLENNSTECVTNAMCKNTQVAGQTAELKCTCNPNFHEAVDDAGSKICAEDTCQHTRDKCMAAGTTTCAEVNAFIGCMLDGVCNPDDPEQMAQFKAAMMEARAKMPADCEFSPSDSCTDKVTGCLSTYLKAEDNCTNTEALGTCLSTAETTCVAGTEVNNGYKLAKSVMQNATAALSCVCVKAANACLETGTANYGAENADTAAKCKAARDLYTCALTTTTCDLSRDIDNRALSVLWSQANTWAAANGCKDTLTEEAANTCPLQLTRCAINYADSKQAAGDNKTASCMATEIFGSCLTDKTPQCLDADNAIKEVFTQQYALANSTCLCINHLTMCYEAIGVLPTDAAVVCPKMATYSLCLLNAKCSLVTDHADMMALKTAHDWYNQHKTAHNCQTTSDGECAQDTGVCADTFITALSKEGVTATEKCSATADSVLCMNAANCSTAIATDTDMLSSARDAATFRLQSLSCTEPTCNVTMPELVACKDTYETAFSAAGTDNSQKCTAQNDMVKCLRKFKCNPHLEDLVQFKYDALKAVDVPNCNLLPLVEVTSVAATSLRVTLPVLLVSFTVAVAIARI